MAQLLSQKTQDHLKIFIKGAKETPYEGGTFVFEVKIPPDYPQGAFYIYAHTLIWHPWIDPTIHWASLGGQSNTVVEKYMATVNIGQTTRLTRLIMALKDLFHMKDPGYYKEGINKRASAQTLSNLEDFKRNAKRWTEKYAIPLTNRRNKRLHLETD